MSLGTEQPSSSLVMRSRLLRITLRCSDFHLGSSATEESMHCPSTGLEAKLVSLSEARRLEKCPVVHLSSAVRTVLAAGLCWQSIGGAWAETDCPCWRGCAEGGCCIPAGLRQLCWRAQYSLGSCAASNISPSRFGHRLVCDSRISGGFALALRCILGMSPGVVLRVNCHLGGTNLIF